jgi:hypothetical protein
VSGHLPEARGVVSVALQAALAAFFALPHEAGSQHGARRACRARPR